MTDLRQGVTETQHAVLDLIEERAAIWSADWGFEEKLRHASGLAICAQRASKLFDQHRHAITAAALLIDAADEISRLINAAATVIEANSQEPRA